MPLAPSSEEAQYGRLVRNGAVNVAGQVVAMLAGLALVPLLLHELGAESYGVLLLALTCAGFAAFLDLGAGSAITREVAAGAPDRRTFLTSAATLLIGFGATVAVLLALGGAV